MSTHYRSSTDDVKVLLSGRFDGGEAEAFLRETGRILRDMGVDAIWVSAVAGSRDTYDLQTMNSLYEMDAMVAFVGDNYGGDTGGGYTTFYELRHAYQNNIPVIIL